MKGLRKKVLNGFYWQFTGTIFQTFFQLFILGVLARTINKSDFGLMQAALVVVAFAKLTSQVGIGAALVQKKDLSEKHINGGGTFALVMSFSLFAIVFFSSVYIAALFKMNDLAPVIKVISVLFLFEGITTVSESLLQREMKQKVIVKINFISYLIGYGVISIFLAINDFGVWSLVYGQIAQSMIKCFLVYLASDYILSLYFGKEINELLRFGGGFTLARLFNFCATQGDNLIIGRGLGADALGLYSRAYAIMVRPVGLLGNAIDSVLFPAMSARQNDKVKLKKVFIDISELVIFVSLPLSIMLYNGSGYIITILLGPDWNEVVFPLQILSVSIVFRMGYKIGSIVTKSTGTVYLRARVEFIYAISMLVFCSFGIPYGISGVAIGALCSIILSYLMMTILSLKILNLAFVEFFVGVGRNILLLTLICLSTWLLLKVSELFNSSILFFFPLSIVSILFSSLLIFLFRNKLGFISYLKK